MGSPLRPREVSRKAPDRLPAQAAASMRLCAITDEVAGRFELALRACEALDIAAVELRTIDRCNIVHHGAATIRRAHAAVEAGGFECPVIDSPFLKTPVVEADWEVLERAFEIAHLFAARTVRVFSGLRAPDPLHALPWVVEALEEALDRACVAGLDLALELEHGCNIATADEAARLLERLPGRALGLVWDPGDEALHLERTPDPGREELVAGAIAHVHVKDALLGECVRLGDGLVDWDGELRTLAAAGYDGFLSLEPHYEDPVGALTAKARESAATLREIAAGAGIALR